MKKVLFNNQEEFSSAISSMSIKYTVRHKQPQRYPCVIVGWIVENDYAGKDWFEFEIVYKEDFA